MTAKAALMTAGGVGGAVGGYYAAKSHLGQDLKQMERSPNKPKAAKAFAANHPVAAVMILPKNKFQQQKLASRGTGGHIGHALLRNMGGGPMNIIRYGAKSHYAKAGYYREEDMLRDELIEQILVAALDEGKLQDLDQALHRQRKFKSRGLQKADKFLHRRPAQDVGRAARRVKRVASGAAHKAVRGLKRTDRKLHRSYQFKNKGLKKVDRFLHRKIAEAELA